MSRPVITEPGLYPNVDEDWYHADCVAHEWGSLSVSAAKLLVPPNPAAKFAYARKNGRLPTKAQKLGTLTHALTLGTPVGPVAVLDFPNRTRTKAFIKAEEEAARLGKQVVLSKEWDEAQAIADAIRLDPTAGALLEGAVDREVSGFWTDPEFGIWLRMRMDAHTLNAWQMPTIVDLKTAKDASPAEFAKSVAEYGYHRQDVQYRQGLAALLGLDDWRDVDFVICVVETEPPYLVATYRVSDGEDGTPDDVGLGLEQLRAARERFRDCSASGVWPGYSDEIERLELPHYKRQDMKKDINDWYR